MIRTLPLADDLRGLFFIRCQLSLKRHHLARDFHSHCSHRDGAAHKRTRRRLSPLERRTRSRAGIAPAPKERLSAGSQATPPNSPNHPGEPPLTEPTTTLADRAQCMGDCHAPRYSLTQGSEKHAMETLRISPRPRRRRGRGEMLTTCPWPLTLPALRAAHNDPLALRQNSLRAFPRARQIIL